MKDEGGQMESEDRPEPHRRKKAGKVLLWIGAVILGLAAATVGLALFLGRAEVQFDFLAGRTPLKVPKGAASPADVHFEVVAYTFRADLPTFIRAVRQELTTLGFKELVNEESGTHIFERSAGGGDPTIGEDPTPTETITVEIEENLRVDHDAKGWVSVFTIDRRKKGLFDRIREWLGL